MPSLWVQSAAAHKLDTAPLTYHPSTKSWTQHPIIPALKASAGAPEVQCHPGL